MTPALSNPDKPGKPRARKASAPRSADPARAALRKEMRAWRETWPTALERDTLLMPDVIAETVVREAERFLKADLPAGFAERLAARAHQIYPRNRHFKKMLNRADGRDYLRMFMRHWTAGWLRRERNPLHKRLPYSFGLGRRLPL